MQEKFDFDLERPGSHTGTASRSGSRTRRSGEQDAWIGGVGVVASARRAGIGERSCAPSAGADAWIGGVGVVASARRAGVGEALMRAAHEEARSRGVERVWLEVIVENTGAFALYEKLGYELVQDVEVWTLPAAEGEHAGREVPRAEAKAQLPERHEPWQRADGTLAHYDDVRGLVTDTRRDALLRALVSAQLQQYAGEPEPLLRALRTFGDVYVLNLPADDPAAAVLRELGGSVSVRQHEMLLEL